MAAEKTVVAVLMTMPPPIQKLYAHFLLAFALLKFWKSLHQWFRSLSFSIRNRKFSCFVRFATASMHFEKFLNGLTGVWMKLAGNRKEYSQVLKMTSAYRSLYYLNYELQFLYFGYISFWCFLFFQRNKRKSEWMHLLHLLCKILMHTQKSGLYFKTLRSN